MADSFWFSHREHKGIMEWEKKGNRLQQFFFVLLVFFVADSFWFSHREHKETQNDVE